MSRVGWEGGNWEEQMGTNHQDASTNDRSLRIIRFLVDLFVLEHYDGWTKVSIKSPLPCCNLQPPTHHDPDPGHRLLIRPLSYNTWPAQRNVVKRIPPTFLSQDLHIFILETRMCHGSLSCWPLAKGGLLSCLGTSCSSIRGTPCFVIFL